MSYTESESGGFDSDDFSDFDLGEFNVDDSSMLSFESNEFTSMFSSEKKRSSQGSCEISQSDAVDKSKTALIF